MSALKAGRGFFRRGRAGGAGRQGEIARELADLVGDAVVEDEMTRGLFRGDGGVVAAQAPAAVVLPGEEGQLVTALRYCHRNGLDVVVRGGATSTRGGAVGGAGCVVIAMTRLREVGMVERRDRLVRAEAGASLTALDEAAAAAGLAFRPTPRGRSPATLGGAIAKDIRVRGGPVPGSIASLVERVRVVLADGEVVEFVGGAACGGGYDFAGLVAGSEGILGIVSAATLRLTAPAPVEQVVVARFADWEGALAAAQDLAWRGVEMAAMEVLGAAFLDGLPGGGAAMGPDEAVVMAAFEGFDEAVAGAVTAAGEVLGGHDAIGVEVITDGEAVRAVWALRESGPARLARGRAGSVSDIVVPAGQVGEAVRAMGEMAERHGLSCVLAADPRAGTIQSLLLAGDEGEEAGLRVKAALDAAAELAGEFQGVTTGELGAGVLKAASPGYGGLEPAAFERQAMVKAMFDGEGRLNRGKVLAADGG